MEIRAFVFLVGFHYCTTNTVHNCDSFSVVPTYKLQFILLQKSAKVSSEAPVTHKLNIDEEFLPFKDSSLDVVVSNLRFDLCHEKK